MGKNTLVLTDSQSNHHEGDFEKKLGTAPKATIIKRRTLHGGVREGVDEIEIDNGAFRFAVLPTRGMSLAKAWLGDLELGWKSPVPGPVHPNYVPLSDASGLGWLEGFDELLCRCGLQSNGAPEFAANGTLKYPLHGRIGNLPAHHVEISSDDTTGEVSVTGVVDEAKFLFQRLRLKSTYSTKPGQNGLRIVDEVTNMSASPAEIQLLYHINFGLPLLDPGARFVAPVKTLVPRDPRAGEGIATWDSYPNEQPGFSEQVYFFHLQANSDHQTQVLLKNAHSTQGVSLRYDTRQLPCFTLWKQTGASTDGYVTGLEPATNFPNPRSFEGTQKRFVTLKPGESRTFEIELSVHPDAAAVAAAESAIGKLQQSKPEIHAKPQAGWTRV